MSEEDYVILRGPSSSQAGSDPPQLTPLDLDEAERAVLFWSDSVNPKRRELSLRLIARVRELEAALAKFTLFRNPDEEIVHYAELCIEAAEGMGRELLHEDLCRLSVVFGRGSDLRDDRDRRINERLKAMITEAVKS